LSSDHRTRKMRFQKTKAQLIDELEKLENGAPISWDKSLPTAPHFSGYPEPLLDEEEPLQSLFDKIPAILHSIDHEGKLVGVSDKWLATFSYDRDEVIGRPSTDFLTPESRKFAKETVLPEFFRTGVCADIPYQIVGRDGEIFDVLLSATTVRDNIAEIDRSLAIITDMTERNRVEKNLKSSESRLAEAQRIAHIGNWSRDLESDEITWSDEVYRVFGFEPGQIAPTFNNLQELVYTDDRDDFIFSLQQTINAGERLPHDFRISRADGSVRWVHVESEAALDESGKPVRIIGTMHDITDRKLHEQNIRQALREAEAANHAKTAFLANMSHELRTPLNAVIGFSEMMVGETFGELGHPNYQDYAQDIHSAGAHLLAMISDILDVSMIEAGKLEFTETKLDLNQIVLSTMKMLTDRAGRSEVFLGMNVSQNLPYLMGDASRLRQILINLMSNAIKFTPPQGKITIRVHQNDNASIILEVEDTGHGIPEDALETVLEPFGQARNNAAHAHEGSGLGLYLCKMLTEMHGGRLGINSQLGNGTTVTVTFPPERSVS